MLKKVFFFLSIIFIAHTGNAQKVLVNVFMVDKVAKKSSDTIYYDAKRKLTWNDFQGKPDYHNIGAALTASGYAFDADITIEGKIIYLNVDVYTFFGKTGSWKKPEINSDYHLLHEQRHFDITRLGAENFINRLVKAKFTKDNYNKVLDSVFDKVYTENIAWQEKYDTETRHSINHEMQLKWNDQIAEELKKTFSQSTSINGR